MRVMRDPHRSLVPLPAAAKRLTLNLAGTPLLAVGRWRRACFAL